MKRVCASRSVDRGFAAFEYRPQSYRRGFHFRGKSFAGEDRASETQEQVP